MRRLLQVEILQESGRWRAWPNTYFWIDRTRHVCGVFLSQVLPFYDHTAIDLLGTFETEVYRALA